MSKLGFLGSINPKKLFMTISDNRVTFKMTNKTDVKTQAPLSHQLILIGAEARLWCLNFCILKNSNKNSKHKYVIILLH